MAELGSYLIYEKKWQTEEGMESTSVWLEFEDDGSLILAGQDMGPSVEQIWGDDDYEYFLRIDPRDVPKFIAMVIGTLFYSAEKDDEDMFSQLQRACESAGIRAEFSSWI